MSEVDQIKQFADALDALDALVNRVRAEYDMTYAAVVGVLQMKSYLMCAEANEQNEEDEE